jgi:hypothetical protein
MCAGLKRFSHEMMHAGMQNEHLEEGVVLLLSSTVHVWCPACMSARRLQKETWIPLAVVIVLGVRNTSGQSLSKTDGCLLCLFAIVIHAPFR